MRRAERWAFARKIERFCLKLCGSFGRQFRVGYHGCKYVLSPMRSQSWVLD